MEFYFNDNDRKELFNFIKFKGGRFVPDVLFNSEKYVIISNEEEFDKYQRNETTHFFLLDDKYFIEPLTLSQNKYINEPNFYVNQRKGGPYIDFSFYRGYSDNSPISYNTSMIEIYPKFIHYNNYNEFQATSALQEYYKDLINYIKGKCTIIKKQRKKYWVSIEVLKEII